MSILTPRTATIPIYQGDDAERLSELRMTVAVAERQLEQKRALLDSQQDRARRVGDPVAVTGDEIAEAEQAVTDAQDAYDAFVDEAAERAVEVKVRAIGKRRFRDLVAAHPMRMEANAEGEEVPHADDFQFGVNVETFAPALLTFAEAGDDGVRTIIGPAEVVKSSRALEEFLDDDLSDGDYDKIFTVAYWSNRAPGSDPKGLRYSRSTSATSE